MATSEQRRDIERLRIVNFVSTMRLTTHFDSERFVYGAPAIEYNPNSFVAMKLRWNARAVALVFAGRQSVMPGSRSGAESRMAILRIVNAIMDGGAMINASEFVVQNMVCHGWFEDEVDIDAIARDPAHSARSRYKSDKFPGLTYSFPHSSVKVNIFVTGQVVIAGARSYDEACHYYALLREQVLVPFSRGGGGGTQTAVRSTCSSSYKIQKTRSASTIHDDCLAIAASAATSRDDDDSFVPPPPPPPPPQLLASAPKTIEGGGGAGQLVPYAMRAAAAAAPLSSKEARGLGQALPHAIMRGQVVFDERHVGDSAAAHRLETLRAGSSKRPFLL